MVIFSSIYQKFFSICSVSQSENVLNYYFGYSLIQPIPTFLTLLQCLYYTIRTYVPYFAEVTVDIIYPLIVQSRLCLLLSGGGGGRVCKLRYNKLQFITVQLSSCGLSLYTYIYMVYTGIFKLSSIGISLVIPIKLLKV